MALAVVLDVVGTDPFEEAADVVLGYVGPERGVGGLGMKIEMEAEEGVPARDRGPFFDGRGRGAVGIGPARPAAAKHYREGQDRPGRS